jgi:hypothetical protein
MTGILSVFARWRLKSAARRYAGRLGGQLARDYGAGETYTAAQINASVLRAGLSTSHLIVCHAAFMTQDEFLAIYPFTTAFVFSDYRALYRSFVPISRFEGFVPAGENSDAQAGVNLM